jgi:hypothetical protein
MGGGGGGDTDIPETEAERALAEVSAKKWQDYQENFVPLENQYMQRVDDIGQQSNIDRVGDQAAAGVMSETSGANVGLQQQQFAKGLDPTSGGFKTKSSALNGAIQKSVQNAKNNGQFAAENSHIKGLGNVVAIGNGQETTAFNSMGSLAGQATSQAVNDSMNDFSRAQGEQDMVGTIAGAGMRGGMEYMKPSGDTGGGGMNNQPTSNVQWPTSPNSYQGGMG